ncbi:MAG: PASTA domain-containing protein [Bacteroidia bacterium]|jgi:beta-lactam-binding protein with PASTA domain
MKFLKILAANALVIAIIVFLLLSGVALVLKNITRHGESMTVPDITGLTIDQAIQLLEDHKLRYSITDSLFFEDKPRLSILEQNPEPQAKVKEGRIIYITINSNTAPLVSIPDLLDVSLRQAQTMLQSVGLKVGQLIYKPDIAQNVVLEQRFQGQPIAIGNKVPKGSNIDLVLGTGLGDSSSVVIPNLIGLTLQDANNLLTSSSLNLGSAVFQGKITDSNTAVIIRQNPDFVEGITLKAGQAIDVYLKQE